MIAAWGLVALCAAAAIRSLFVGIRFVQALKRKHPNPPPNDSGPVRVVLCLRGNDPFLCDCIAGLLGQDYRDYEVMIVLDSCDDPAWQIAHDATADATVPVTIKPLLDRCTHRSLKMNAVLQAVSDLPDDCAAVAIADADVVPSPSWLRSLVEPLSDPQVGISTGIRWCIPESSEWGTIVRYLWSSFAEPQRHAHQIPWAGSLAIRRDLVDTARDSRIWQRSLSDDVPLAHLLHQKRLRLVFVADAVSAVREVISLVPCISFLSRQMTWVRLYHPRWPAILADCLLTATAGIAGPICIAALLASEARQPALLSAAVWALFVAALCVSHFLVESRVFKIIRSHGGSTYSPLAAWIKCFVAAPILPPLYFACTLYAQFRRSVTWRGIRYKFQGPWESEMQDDAPFQMSPTSNNASVM